MAPLAAALTRGVPARGGDAPPLRQLRLLRAAWSWVLAHAAPPPSSGGCACGGACAASTWQAAGAPLFGGDPESLELEEVRGGRARGQRACFGAALGRRRRPGYTSALPCEPPPTRPPRTPTPGRQALLHGATGAWAERAAALLVAVARACGLEAKQLWGFWKDGCAAHGVPPGGRLLCHNHSWCAAKVGGAWRLLDPAFAVARCVRRGRAASSQPVCGGFGVKARGWLCMQPGRRAHRACGHLHATTRRGRAPFFAPPEAFASTRLPFEPAWQLLAAPLDAEAFWARAEARLALFEAGGALLDAQLRAVNELPPSRRAHTPRVPLGQ